MNTEDLITTGIGTFGGDEDVHLFRVEPGHPADCVLMHWSQLMACVQKLTLAAGIEQDGDMAWAAHYLSGMAKALMEDVTHPVVTGEG